MAHLGVQRLDGPLGDTNDTVSEEVGSTTLTDTRGKSWEYRFDLSGNLRRIYTTATWRQANASSANQVGVVVGLVIQVTNANAANNNATV